MNRSPGDILLQIPLDDTIVAKETSDDFSQEQRLALVLLEGLKKGHPYISNVLPKDHFSFWTLPSSLWENLKPVIPRCYRESFQATRSMVLDFCSEIEREGYTMEEILWAFSMVRSRSMAVPELRNDDDTLPLALIPGLDLFNHAFDSSTLLHLEKQKWTLTSSKPLAAGDQVFLSYGDDKDNWKLILTYGFSTKTSKNPLVFWTWEDLLQAAGSVRPSVFPSNVQKQLLNHPQLYESYTKLSENRATFSYNPLEKKPRESLEKGLMMITSLATQLGHGGDTTLASDVLFQLLNSRIGELKDARTKLNSEIPSNWKPFVESLFTVIEEEETHLKAEQI